MQLTKKDKMWATIMAPHIPFTPQKIGRMITDKHSKIKIREQEIMAETIPLFRAVKKAEAKILKPANKKAIK